MYRNSAAPENDTQKDSDEHRSEGFGSGSDSAAASHFDDLAQSLIRLTNPPTYPPYWPLRRHALSPVLSDPVHVRCLDQRRPWERLRLHWYCPSGISSTVAAPRTREKGLSLLDYCRFDAGKRATSGGSSARVK
jgi:hypothetical protein